MVRGFCQNFGNLLSLHFYSYLTVMDQQEAL